jgi:hypothetical protein
MIHRRASGCVEASVTVSISAVVGKYINKGELWMTIQVLEDVSSTLRTANLTTSERDFCEQWLAKSSCYMRTLRFTDTEPSAEALATLGSKLGYYANELARRNDATSKHWAGVLTELRTQTQSALEDRVKERWQRVCSA